MASEEPEKKNKDNNQAKKEKKCLTTDEVILYSIIGFTGFCLLAGTLAYLAPYIKTDWLQEATQNKEASMWAGEVLKDGFFLGLGALLALFRQQHGLKESIQDIQRFATELRKETNVPNKGKGPT